jgi:hypothetical protein
MICPDITPSDAGAPNSENQDEILLTKLCPTWDKVW